MYAILAFIPIIVTVVLMVAFNWPAKRALPLAWVLAGQLNATINTTVTMIGMKASIAYKRIPP